MQSMRCNQGRPLLQTLVTCRLGSTATELVGGGADHMGVILKRTSLSFGRRGHSFVARSSSQFEQRFPRMQVFAPTETFATGPLVFQRRCGVQSPWILGRLRLVCAKRKASCDEPILTLERRSNKSTCVWNNSFACWKGRSISSMDSEFWIGGETR
jgi:hypothetical protein